jgi:hypothetical protein
MLQRVHRKLNGFLIPARSAACGRNSTVQQMRSLLRRWTPLRTAVLSVGLSILVAPPAPIVYGADPNLPAASAALRLKAVPALINTGVPTTTTFIANIEPNPNLIVESVTLIEVNAAGQAIRVVGRMYDDGTNGDQIKNDNNYTLQMTISELLPISLQYQASVAYRGALLRTTSPISNVTVAAQSFAKPVDRALLVTDDDGTYPVNQLIAFIVEGTPLSAVQALASSVGAIVGYSSSVNAYQLELPTTNLSTLNAAIAALERNPIVLDVLKNTVVTEILAVDNDLTQLKAANPNFCFTGLPSASSQSCTGAYDKIRAIEGFQSLVDFNIEFAPIRVGIIDESGALSTHEEFEGVDLIGGETEVSSSHATKMAGIIGANNRAAFGLPPFGQMNGLLAGVPSSANSSGSKVRYTLDTVKFDGEYFDVMVRVDNLATQEVQVINMSFYVALQGGGDLTIECAKALGYRGNIFMSHDNFIKQTKYLREGFRKHKNILFVVAAGNYGTDVFFMAPANIDEPNVITIGATDLFDKRAIWGLKNLKPEVQEAIERIEGCSEHRSSDFGEGVDLAAPGVDVYAPTASTTNQPTSDKWTFVDGTSPAAPLVAGTAGMLLAINPGLLPEDLVEILKKTADPITTDRPMGVPGHLQGLRLNFNAATTIAQYTAIDLYPARFTESQALGASFGHQVGLLGSLFFGGTRPFHALLWNGSADSVVDLHPAGFERSRALGIAGSEQVGIGDLSNTSHALLWKGSASSVVDLHPSAFISSSAFGTDGAHQVGAGNPPGEDFAHALLWTGSAASVVDLHPTGFVSSSANGIAGSEQVGIGTPGPPEPVPTGHALLWKGSATSVVDLHPSAFIASVANGTDGAQQVGYGTLPGNIVHAFLWTGSADSVVDLHPEGFVSSQANGVAGGHQVGNGLPNGAVPSPAQLFQHALLWNGSASSVVDLHMMLPSGFDTSAAFGIDSEGNIVGVASGAATDYVFHAFLWKRRTP